jgi:glycosyltransferase involved in cell wall biosynthesis
MRICIPSVDREAGGSGTFRRQWREWLTEQGIFWTEDLNASYDILFVNAWQTPYQDIYRQKRRLPDLRVVHRVDGAGKDYGRTDGADALQQAVGTLADATIFQSDYCRQTTFHKYHIISLDGVTIYNPVDTEHFTPQGQRLENLPTGNLKIITAIWSDNRRKGAWHVPILAAANPDLTFLFVGRRTFQDAPANVIDLGMMDRDALAIALRSADVFLNLSENDPCPNIVIEAMASGLPVLYIPSGGTPELVAAEGGLPIEDDAAFRPQVERIRSELTAYQLAARRRAVEHFARDKIFQQYMQVLESAHRRPLPHWGRHWFSHGQVMRQWLRDKIVNYRDWIPG